MHSVPPMGGNSAHSSWEPQGQAHGALGVGHVPLGLEPTPFVDLAPASTAARVAADDLLPTVELHGVRLHAVTEAQASGFILDQLDQGRGGWVITPNLDHLRRIDRSADLRQMYSSATLVVADGMPLIWASRLQGTPLPERVAGSSLISTLSAGAAKRGRSVFLLGGDEGTAEQAARVLRERCSNLVIAGTYFPKPGFEQDPAQMRELIRSLCQADPDIVYVGLGSPKQERLIQSLHHHLPQAWWLGVGISFSFLAGAVRRAPAWAQKTGLEWLHRLAQEPRRLAKRYLVDGLPFAAVLLGRAMLRRFRSRSLREAVPQPH